MVSHAVVTGVPSQLDCELDKPGMTGTCFTHALRLKSSALRRSNACWAAEESDAAVANVQDAKSKYKMTKRPLQSSTNRISSAMLHFRIGPMSDESRMWSIHCFVFVIVAGAFIALEQELFAQAPPTVTTPAREKFITDLQTRHEQIGTFRCELSETTRYSSDWMRRMQKQHPSNKTKMPVAEIEQMVATRTWQLRFDGQQYFTRREGGIPDMDAGAVVEDRRTVLFDGKTQTLLNEATATRSHHNAIIQDKPTDFEYLSLKPIWWYTRFMDKQGFGCPSSQFTVRSDLVHVFGKAAIVVDCSASGEVFEFDIERGHLPVRYRNGPDGEATVTVEIDYVEGAETGWRPEAWVVKSVTGNKIDTETKVRILSWEQNVEFGPDDFQIELPKGTLLYDKRAQSGKYSVIDDAGRKSDISKTDVLHGNVQSLIEGRNPAERLTNSDFPWHLLLVQVVILLGVVLAVLWSRRGRDKKKG